jgi:hypothetical protein
LENQDKTTAGNQNSTMLSQAEARSSCGLMDSPRSTLLLSSSHPNTCNASISMAQRMYGCETPKFFSGKESLLLIGVTKKRGGASRRQQGRQVRHLKKQLYPGDGVN